MYKINSFSFGFAIAWREREKHVAFHCAQVDGIENASNVNASRVYLVIIVTSLEFKSINKNLHSPFYYRLCGISVSICSINFRAELFNCRSSVSFSFIETAVFFFRVCHLLDYFINQTKCDANDAIAEINNESIVFMMLLWHFDRNIALHRNKS